MIEFYTENLRINLLFFFLRCLNSIELFRQKKQCYQKRWPGEEVQRKTYKELVFLISSWACTSHMFCWTSYRGLSDGPMILLTICQKVAKDQSQHEWWRGYIFKWVNWMQLQRLICTLYRPINSFPVILSPISAKRHTLCPIRWKVVEEFWFYDSPAM